MINETLVFLKNSLNAHLSMGRKPSDPQEDPVVFPVGQNTDSINFKLGAVSLLLVSMQQEDTLRAPNLYRRTLPDGTVQNVNPEVRLNLYVLFVAKYQQYEDALRNLSDIINYFQNHRLFNQLSAPILDDTIEQLVIELITPSFSEQNEIWGALRSHYHPSVLYKIKTLIYDSDPTGVSPTVQERDTQISQ